jgi:RNA polymerase sigma-70 factor (sigma-E family)
VDTTDTNRDDTLDRTDTGFEDAWVQHRAHLWRVAWLICRDADQADDIVAAAGARAWRSWGGTAVRDPKAYLRRTVVNEATDGFRRRERDRRWLRRRTGEGRGEPTVADRVSDRVDLAEALARLTVEQRAAVVLRYWADLSEADAAAALGVSVGTVKSRTHRALAALARDLDAPTSRRTEDKA